MNTEKLLVLNIDIANNVVEATTSDGKSSYPIGSPDAFRLISQAWLRSGWDTKYVYSFSWMGRPIIQLPEDMIRIQEVIYQVKPDVLIETGVAHGGSLIFYASIFKAMGKGRVIGIDIEIRSHNRKAIEEHNLFEYITLVEGSSIEPEIVNQVKSLVKPEERVLVVLDSNHTKNHVLAELNAYGGLVSSGSYIVATDGIMKDVVGAPRSQPDWETNNPYHAAQEFSISNPEFILEQPEWDFNESNGLTENITYWPGSWLKKK
jgi:cephalosporin hydroxylase